MTAVLVDGVGNWIIYATRRDTIQRVTIPGVREAFVRTGETHPVDGAEAPIFRQEGTAAALRQQKRLSAQKEPA